MKSADKTERVCIVTVTYNSSGVVDAMLRTVPHGVAVVLVDNGSADADGLQACAEAEGAHLLQQDENLGFGAACNAGAAICDREFLLFLNPDAALLPGAIDALVDAADAHPEASALNPLLRNADGSPAIKRFTYLISKRRKLPPVWPGQDIQVPFLTGSALFVRRCAFEKIGGFDSNIFLYHEDDDLALRLKDRCGPLMIATQAMVEHRGGGASGDDPGASRIKTWCMVRSRVYAMRKHQRPLPFATVLLSAIRQFLKPSVLMSSDLRAVKWLQLRAVLSTLRDGGAGKGKGAPF